ncbi:ArsR/SmtB family transcription factor [Halomicrococcus sp. SG-WS-1]|uniref:ArsR/SmtB family transcription factor n=1 Tax=Halomicrococcus sp. SG-WS-1 TaxID=3439057 RepID=UPI003F7A5AB3
MSDQRFSRRVPSSNRPVQPSKTLSVDGDEVLEVAEALGSSPRWKIVQALTEHTRTINELADTVDLTKGTVSVHVKQLEEAGILASRYNVSDSGGVEKEIGLAVDEISLDLETP